MLDRVTKKLSYSNVIATIALFVALGGAAVAAGLAKNSVGTKQLKANAVTTKKIKNKAVNAKKLANGAVGAGKIAGNAVGAEQIQNGAVSTAKLAPSSVINSTIAKGVVGTGKLGNGVVSTVKLADGAVTAAKLGPEVAPLLGTLKSGQTLRGVFDVGGTAANAGDLARGAVSFQFPLSGNALPLTVMRKGQTTPTCPGIGTGSAPAAAAGNVCIYLTEELNLDESAPLVAENNARLGFGLKAKAKASGEFTAFGQWAVTAP